MAKMYIEAVECCVCKKLHRSESTTFLTVEGNILIGETDGIVGAAEWKDGETPVRHFCPECLVKVIQSGGEIRSFEPLIDEESELTYKPDKSMEITLLPLSFKGLKPVPIPSHELWLDDAEKEFEAEQEAIQKLLTIRMEEEVQFEPELELFSDDWNLD